MVNGRWYYTSWADTAQPLPPRTRDAPDFRCTGAEVAVAAYVRAMRDCRIYFFLRFSFGAAEPVAPRSCFFDSANASLSCSWPRGVPGFSRPATLYCPGLTLFFELMAANLFNPLATSVRPRKRHRVAPLERRTLRPQPRSHGLYWSSLQELPR